MASNEFSLIALLKANITNFESGMNNAKNKTKSLNKSIGDTSALTDKLKSEVDDMTGGAVSGFTSMADAIKKSLKGLKGFKLALASTGIGALIIALGALITYLRSSAEGQERLNKLLGSFKGVIGYVQTLLEKFGQTLVDVWSNPKKYLNEFIDAIKTNLFNKIKGLGDYFVALKDIASNTFSFLAAKVKGFFSTDSGVKEAMKKQAEEAVKGIEEGVKSAGGAILTMGTGLDSEQRKNVVEGFKNLGKEAGEAFNRGRALASAEEQYKKDKRAFEEFAAEQERIISENLLKSRELEKYSAIERMQFIKEAQEATDELYNRKITLAEKELDLHRQNMALSPTSQADLDKEAELQANINSLVKERNDKYRELINNQNEINTGIANEAKALQSIVDEINSLNDTPELDESLDFVTPLQAYVEKLDELKAKQQQAFSAEEYQQYQAEIDATKAKIDEFTGAAKAGIMENIMSAESLAGSLGSSFTNFFESAESGWSSLSDAVKNFANTIIQQLVTRGVLKILSFLIPSGSFLGGLLGFSKGGIVPKFATGGIVGGSLYNGDKVLARVNSGEMILTKQQQSKLFSIINKGTTTGGEVRFEIAGDKLVGVLSNYNRKINSYR